MRKFLAAGGICAKALGQVWAPYTGGMAKEPTWVDCKDKDNRDVPGA